MQITIKDDYIMFEGKSESLEMVNLPITRELVSMIENEFNVEVIKDNINLTSPGELLSAARKNLNLTQDNVAKLVGISRLAYINIEQNKATPSVIVALKICKVLNVPVQDVFKVLD